MDKVLTVSVLGCLTLFLASCSTVPTPEPVKAIEVVEKEVRPPKPIVPPVDQLRMRDVKFIIITPENVEEVFKELDFKVLFAVTPQGYEKMSLNLSDVRALIEQQQTIIGIYESQYE